MSSSSRKPKLTDQDHYLAFQPFIHAAQHHHVTRWSTDAKPTHLVRSSPAINFPHASQKRCHILYQYLFVHLGATCAILAVTCHIVTARFERCQCDPMHVAIRSRWGFTYLVLAFLAINGVHRPEDVEFDPWLFHSAALVALLLWISRMVYHGFRLTLWITGWE